MKNKIIMNESQLTDIIKESVEEVISEISINAKRRNEKNVENAFRKGKRGINGIKTIAVFTAQNPDSMPTSDSYNKKANHILSKALKAAHYPIIPAKGKFGGNTEYSFAVINIGIDVVKYYCGHFQQTSFIYTILTNNGVMHSDYYEKQNETKPYDKKLNPYVIKDSSDGFVDMSDADDNFTIIGKTFKYQIPFPTMMEITEKIENNFLNENNIKWFSGTLDDSINYTIEKVGQSPFIKRKVLYNGIN